MPEDVYSEIKLVIQNEAGIVDEDLDSANINIDDALIALEEALPELPEGYHWNVRVND